MLPQEIASITRSRTSTNKMLFLGIGTDPASQSPVHRDQVMLKKLRSCSILFNEGNLRSADPAGYIEDHADPEDGVNQPVARSQTEDCYREIPRDSIWPEVRAGKHGTRLGSQLPGCTSMGKREREAEERREPKPCSVSNESIDKFGVSPDPVAALSLLVTFHVYSMPCLRLSSPSLTSRW